MKLRPITHCTPSRKQRGFLLNPFRFGLPGGDPYFGNVVSLLHFNGTSGSTTFTDQKGRAWTGFGNAQITTAGSVFGGGALALDGNGDWIETATSTDFVFAGDFTIECWLRLAAQTTNYMTLLGSGTTTFSAPCNFFMCYGNNVPVIANRRKVGFGNFTFNPLVTSTTLIDVGTWYHVAVARSGNTVRLFVNGVLEGSAVNTSTFDFSALKTLMGINGWDGSASHFNGLIDDMRVTKGVGRYVANFTPPAAQYPDF